MISRICLSSLFILLMGTRCFAQFQFPTIHTYNFTPNELSLAGAFTGLPTQSVFAAWYNPAQLGFKTEYSFAIGGTPTSDYLFNNRTSNVGFRYHQTFTTLGRDIEFGVSLYQLLVSHNKIDLSTIQNRELGNNTAEIYEQSRSIHVGLGSELRKGIQVSLGYSLKNTGIGFDFTSANQAEVPDDIFNNSFVHDVGILSEFNMIELLSGSRDESGKPSQFTIALGYSIKNLSKNFTVEYKNPLASDVGTYPQPRTVQFGISLSHSSPYQLKNGKWIRLIEVNLSREARDLMILKDGDERDYQGYKSIFASDISLVNNLIKRKTLNKVLIHEGLRFSLFETIELSYGTIIYGEEDSDVYDYDLRQMQSSWGISLNLRGLKKIYFDDALPFLKPISLQISSSTSYNFVKEFTLWGIQLGYQF